MNKYVSLRDVKRGDIYFESQGGQDAAFVALTDARRVQNDHENGYEVESREIPSGRPQRHYEHVRPGAYGLRLYSTPQYTRPDLGAIGERALELLEEVTRG